jgi:glycosyltransferase involved in cell wall biosynthesis
MWRVLIAAEHDRVLLKIAASVLTLNIALNLALLPPYGFRAAAVTAVASEVVSIAASAIVHRRRMGFLPSARYAWAIGLAALAAVAVALLAPGPWPVAAAAALAVYTLILLVLPGTAREGLMQVRRELRPAAAPAPAAVERAAPVPPPHNPEPVDLSVVIAARNAADTIGAQLESLTRQDWEGRWEVIVVDNGSSDETEAVVASFADRLPQLRVVSANTHYRIPYARNRGVEVARGSFIAFCDADDEVSPGWLTAIAAGLEGYVAVATPRDHDRLNEPWVRDSRDPPTPDGLHPNWYPPYLPHTGGGGMGVRREAHEAIGGFDESLFACEDNDYCFRLQLRGFELGHVEGAVYHYRFKDDIGAIFRQAYWYSEQNARVQRMYRTDDSRIPRRWAWPVKNWPTLLAALPGAVRKGGRARLAWMVGWELGRLRGSIRYRIFAL